MRDARFEWLDAEIAAGRGEQPGELHMLFGGTPEPEHKSRYQTKAEHAAQMRERNRKRKPATHAHGKATMRELTLMALNKK